MVQRLVHRVRSHPFIHRRPGLRQFIKFAMVGVINTLTSVSFYLLLTRWVGWDPLIANAGAFVVAVTVSFILNKSWTFRDQHRAYARQYAKFFTVNLIGLGLSESIIYLLHHQLGLHDLVAFFMAVTIVVFWNFFANKFWTFGGVTGGGLEPEDLR